MSRERTYDVLVVGGGPAGIAAAASAAEADLRVGLVDENLATGGQIWRGKAPPSARAWQEALATGGVTVMNGVRVVGRLGSNTLLAESDDEAFALHYEKLVLATGARELFLPFPGWTLANVMGAGGLQALVKGGMSIAGKRVIVAGSGPLLLAVAVYLRRAGAEIAFIAEQAPRARVRKLQKKMLGHPGKLFQAVGLVRALMGVKYAMGQWPVAASGEGAVDMVRMSDGVASWYEPCDYLACGFGLVANVELALLMGCAVVGGAVVVDEQQGTSVENVFCAGEPTGIGGVDLALAEGQIAGYSAVGMDDAAKKLYGIRVTARHFAQLLDDTFALRDELKTLAKNDTIVCRCEDVRWHQLEAYSDWRAAKLQTRCGMGPCQGRICGAATEFLLGWGPEGARPPVAPVRVGSLAAPDEGGAPR
jgi:NADPH-dependent 2,4-dienoyl-CoA reductase/sulfur reductase-like enzyme